MLQSQTTSDQVKRPAAESGPGELILISANTAWNVWNFRMHLVRALQAAGHRVAVAAVGDGHETSLIREGIEFYPLHMRASGLSPLRDMVLLHDYLSLLKRLRPAAYLGFTAKPNVVGSLAARMLGIPRINTLTGLGTAFIHGRPLEHLLSSLYRLALSGSKTIFFHNKDDRDLFVSRGLVKARQVQVIPGSGVDLDRYAFSPVEAKSSRLTFLFVGRLLWEKGVGEFAEAARIVRQSRPEAEFQILGAFADDGRAVPKAKVDDWQAEGRIRYLGTCTDIRPFIAAADCIVLPSWREGLPRVLLEAAAIGRPSIASDVPGCRHVVVDGTTGLLCEARSGEAFAQAMLQFIDLPASERAAMGQRARAHAEEHFGVEHVCARYLEALARIGAPA